MSLFFVLTGFNNPFAHHFLEFLSKNFHFSRRERGHLGNMLDKRKNTKFNNVNEDNLCVRVTSQDLPDIQTS